MGLVAKSYCPVIPAQDSSRSLCVICPKFVYRCVYMSNKDTVAIPIPGLIRPFQYSVGYRPYNWFFNAVCVWVWSWNTQAELAKSFSGIFALAAVTFAGNTVPSPGFTSQMYAMLEYSVAYLAGGTTIAAWPWIPPPLVDGCDAAFSVCISCAISISTRAGGSSILGTR